MRPGAAVERHPLGAGRRRPGRRAAAAERVGRRRSGSVPVASFTVTKLRWLAAHEPDNAARTAAVCLPHDWLTWRLRGTGGLDDLRHRPRRRERHRLLVAGAPAPTGPTCSSCGFGRVRRPAAAGARPAPRRPAGTPAGRGARAGHRRQRGAPRSGSAPARATWSSRSARRGRCSRAPTVPDRRPDRHRRRVRRRHRAVPAAGVHAQRRPGAGRRGRACSASTTTSWPGWRSSAPAGADGLVLVPYLEGERTPNRPGRHRRAARPDAGHRPPARTWPAPRSRGLLCALADGLDALVAAGAPVRPGAPGRRRRAVRGGRADRARGLRPPGAGAAARRVRRRRGRPAGRLGALRRRAPPEWAAAETERFEAEPTPAVRERYAAVRDLTATQLR